jgi:thiamine biosynthesis lipoprotein
VLIDLVKQTRILMGMPVTLEVVDPTASEPLFDEVFNYFVYVDEKFSTYKEKSEISRINRGELKLEEASEDMTLIFELAEQTRRESNGYFDIHRNGIVDPSGIVKGWAIYNAAEIFHKKDFENFYVDAGGDIQACGKSSQGEKWRVGIRNPFNMDEIVKVLSVTDCGVATSGTYVRGQHIYNPKNEDQPITDILSLTVIGPDVYEADRFATAAFAMGRSGIDFIEVLPGFEGYMIDKDEQATYTTGFARYVINDSIH